MSSVSRALGRRSIQLTTGSLSERRELLTVPSSAAGLPRGKGICGDHLGLQGTLPLRRGGEELLSEADSVGVKPGGSHHHLTSASQVTPGHGRGPSHTDPSSSGADSVSITSELPARGVTAKNVWQKEQVKHIGKAPLFQRG